MSVLDANDQLWIVVIMKKQNPIAKNLRTPLYRKRIVAVKNGYNRKKSKTSFQDAEDYEDEAISDKAER